MATLTFPPFPFYVDFEKILVEKCKNQSIHYYKFVTILTKKKEFLSNLLL